MDDLEIIILSEIRKKKTNTCITYMWNLNMTQMNLFMEQKQTYDRQRIDLWLPKE